MKTKSLLLAFGLCSLLLSGCVASAGPEYGYYPPVQPRYYPPRPVVVVPGPYYRQPYRSHYDGYRREGGNGYRRQGGYDGNFSRGNYGHSRRRED